MKSKNHPTLKYEIDWYNSEEGKEFRDNYDLDTSGEYYKYIPKNKTHEKTNIEVEGGEILLESKEGHYAVIPAKHRQEAMDMVKDGCDDCINNIYKHYLKI